jgi:hypothetical protein
MKLCLSLTLVLLVVWGSVPAVRAQDDNSAAGAADDNGAADDAGADANGSDASGAGGEQGDAKSSGSAASGSTATGANGSDEGQVEEDLAPAGHLKGGVAGSIQEMVRLLDRKDYEGFLDHFLSPQDKAEMLKQTTLQNAAQQFGASKAADLLAILQSLRSKIPRYTSDGNTAAFTYESGSPPVRQEIRFQRADRNWYLRND